MGLVGVQKDGEALCAHGLPVFRLALAIKTGDPPIEAIACHHLAPARTRAIKRDAHGFKRIPCWALRRWLIRSRRVKHEACVFSHHAIGFSDSATSGQSGGMSQIDDFLDGKKPANPSANTTAPAPAPKVSDAVNKFLDDGPSQDNALVRGWNNAKHSMGITKSLATGDAADTAQRVKAAAEYQQANPGSQEGQELSQAWEKGDGITGGVKAVGGEIAKDWNEADNWVGGVRSVAKNAKAMGEGIVAQVPNMIAPMAGMIGGGLAGTAVGGPVGTAVGAFAGASAGNALVEGGGMLQKRLSDAKIDPTDTAAVEAYVKQHGDAALGEAAIKGAIIGGVDTLTAGVGGKLLNAPARAAADRALTSMGVDLADKAAVKAASQSDAFKQLIVNDAAFAAATSGARNVARHAGVGALDPAGEFAGEFVGGGVATGDWDAKDAALEAFSSLGQSAMMYGGQRAYQAATSPLRGGKPGADASADGGAPAATPLLLGSSPPDTLIVFPDGSVGRAGEMEARLAGMDPEAAMLERARLLGIKPEKAAPAGGWETEYLKNPLGRPYAPVENHLADLQEQIRAGTQFTSQETVDRVRNAMEDAWLSANVRHDEGVTPAQALEQAQAVGDEVSNLAGDVAAVDAKVRMGRILDGVQNALDAGKPNALQVVQHVNSTLERIGEQPLAQDEMGRARRILDAHAAFTGKTTPATMPDAAARAAREQAALTDNSSMEALIPERRRPSEVLDVDPSRGALSKATALAVDATPGSVAMNNPLLASAANSGQSLQNTAPAATKTAAIGAGAPAASPFNVAGAISGNQADQAQQVSAQQPQAGNQEAARGAVAPAVSAGAAPAGGRGLQAPGLTDAAAIEHDGAQAAPQAGPQAAPTGASAVNPLVGLQASPAAAPAATGVNQDGFGPDRGVRPGDGRTSSAAATAPYGAGRPAASQAAAVGDGRQDVDGAAQPAPAVQGRASDATGASQPTAAVAAPSQPLSVGVAPGNADAVTVRDGTVYVGDYEAVDYDSGDPVRVPAGATRGQVAQALRDAGALTSRQRVFGLTGSEDVAMDAPLAKADPAKSPARVAAQNKAIERINSERGAFFFVKDKADAFVASHDLGDGYEVVQQGKAYFIKPKGEQAAAAKSSGVAADSGIVVREGKGHIAGKFLADADGEGVPGGPWATQDEAREAAQAWRAKTEDHKVDAAALRQRKDALVERLRDGQEPTAADLHLLGLRQGSSDLQWFIPSAADLFGINSRAVRPLIADLIRVGHTDMGAKREYVNPSAALVQMAKPADSQKNVAPAVEKTVQSAIKTEAAAKPDASADAPANQPQKATPAVEKSAPAATEKVAAEPGWTNFDRAAGSKGVPRAEMPQIKAEHRGAMTNFMNARGIAHAEETVKADSLKPTQREFSRAKVEKAKAYEGGNRAILVSRDNHVLDGHHQWLAALEGGEHVRVIRLDAPIDDLVKAAHEFPSSTVDAASAAKAGNKPAAAKRSAEPRRMDADGRPLDGKPIMPGDTFAMVSGRTTTPFPVAKGDLATQRWLAQNALNEAEANGDGFNAGPFRRMVEGLAPSKAKDRMAISPSDQDTLNMFLWDYQPAAVKSMLKPLVSPSRSLTESDASAGQIQASGRQAAGEQNQPIVLQNRDRSTAASIQQMNAIAANPDYLRTGPSRTMDQGAPVVFGDMPAGAVLGSEVQVADGRGDRYAMRYAVVEAADLIASNHADGTTNAAYAKGEAGKLRAVAGNGRAAGLIEAYDRKTMGPYRAELESDAVTAGVDRTAVAKMKAPVLVRVMDAADVTPDIGDRSNTVATARLSPVEEAANDAKRIDIGALEFDDRGEPTRGSVMGFIHSMPEAERGNMLNRDGSPTRQAVDRLMAATFKQAYGNDELVRLYAQATDPDARAVMSALAQAAGPMANLTNTGEFDVRETVAQAAGMAVNAARDGLKLTDVVKNHDFQTSPEAFAVAEFMAANIRSGKAMGAGLRNLAQSAVEQAKTALDNAQQAGMFGDQPTLSREQLFESLKGNDEQSQTTVPDAGRPGPDAGVAERQEADGTAAGGGRRGGQAAGEGARGQDAQEVAGGLQHAEASLRRLRDEAQRLWNDVTTQAGRSDDEAINSRKVSADLKRRYRENREQVRAQAQLVDSLKNDTGDFALTTQTPDELRARADAADKAEADAAQTKKDQDARAQADAERDGFTLTGSDRAADVAAANGQQDLRGAKEEPAQPKSLDEQIADISDDDIDAMLDAITAENADVAETEKPLADRSDADVEPPAKSPRKPRAPRAPRGETTKNTERKPRTTKSKAERADTASQDSVNRTASAIADSLGYNVSSAGKNAIDGLVKLFGGNGKFSSGLTFDEETYAKAKPYFQAMLADARAAGRDLMDLARLMLENFGSGAKPFIKRFVQDTREEIKNGENDAGSAVRGEGQKPLGAVAAEDGGRDARRGDVQPGAAESQQGSVSPDRNPDEGGDATARSRGNGAAGADSAVARAGGRPAGGRQRVKKKSEPAAEVAASAEIERAAPINVPAIDFTIDAETRLGQGTEGVKYRDNIAAIRLLKQIESEGRRASPDEQRVLARYVGWGGLKNAFQVAGARDEAGIAKGWEKQAAELKELLTPQEYRSARNSTTAAHYTSETVVKAVWKMAERMGFNGGAVLEPSMGTGNFLGLMPPALRGKTATVGVEYDGLTARIAARLYPNQTVLHSGFQQVPMPANNFALAIGNPPFGKEKLFFRGNPAVNGMSIHNQFFVASLDAVAPNGLMSMVVSHYLMDAQNNSARLAMAERAEFVGGIRLPDTAFKENARTEVVTDILMFRKRDEAEAAAARIAVSRIRGLIIKKPAADKISDQDAAVFALADRLQPEIEAWVNAERVQFDDAAAGEEVGVNKYFMANPDRVVGTMDASGTMNARAGLNVRLEDPSTFAARLDEAIDKLPTRAPVDELAARTTRYHRDMATSLRLAVDRVEPGAVSRTPDGELKTAVLMDTGGNSKAMLAEIPLNADTPWKAEYSYNLDGTWSIEQDVTDADGKKVKVMKGDRATNRNVKETKIFASTADIPAADKWGDKRIAMVRAMLPIRDAMKRQLALEASDAVPSMLEANRAKLNAAYDAFVSKHGPLHGAMAGAIVDTMPDGALALAAEVQDAGGKVRKADILSKRVMEPVKPRESASSAREAMAISLGESGRVDIDRVAALLGTDEAGAAKALSEGESPVAFMDPETNQWESADSYLSGLVRRKLLAAKAVGMDSNVRALEKVQPAAWDSTEITPTLGSNWIPTDVYADFLKHLGYKTPRVSYTASVNAFSVRAEGGAKPEWMTGPGGMPTYEIVANLLNSKAQVVREKNKDGVAVVNQQKSDEAEMKAREIANEFMDWAYSSDERRGQLVDVFNEKFNTRVVRQRDGSHLTLPGSNPLLKMRRHQKNAIWRGITDKVVLFDHVVGAGKAQPLDAKVLTPTGWVRMGDIQPGMLVITGSGQSTLVEEVFPQGEKEIFRVVFSDGASTECCDEHLWLTQTYRERGYAQRASRLGKDWACGAGAVRELSEIRATLTSSHLGTKNHSIPMVAPVKFTPQAVPLDPYLLGALLGDGHLGEKTVSISGIDREVINNLVLPVGVRLRESDNGGRCPSWRLIGTEHGKNPALEACRALGLSGKLSHDKFVPVAYLFNGEDVRLAVLRGLMDTDGTVSKAGHSCYFSTVSGQLADDVTFLTQSLGGTVKRRSKTPSYTHKGERRQGRLAHQLTVTLPASINPFAISRKAGVVVPKSSYAPARYIVSVESVGKKQAQCIRVADPSHLYVTDDFIVTHNTYTAIGRAMERKRMGLSRKPMVVVPNHLVEQWGADIKNLYPGANVLAATKKDFEGVNRRRLFAKIAAGDYDMVVMGHSSFGFINLDPETEARYLDDELRAAYEGVAAAEEEAGDAAGWRKPFNVAEAERLVKKLEERMARLRDAKRDRLLTFEEMGVDDLTIDESHEFKNLAYSSRLTKVSGMGNKTGSNKAMDVHLKLRTLHDMPNGSIAFLTGTPISNSVAEMYLILKNLAPNELREMGMENFDAWRAPFVSHGTAWEPTESGSVKEVARLGREWMNMRSLMDLYYSVADAVTMDDIKAAFKEETGKEFPVPKVRSQVDGNGDREMVAIKPTDAQREILRDIVAGFDGLDLIADMKERNAERLRLMDRARKVSLDARAVNPNARVADGSGKIGEVVKRVYDLYDRYSDDRGTQLIFLDRSVPKAKGDDAILKQYDALVAERTKAMGIMDADKRDAELSKIEDSLEKFDANEMAELRSAQQGGWNAYDEIKRQLVAKGIPENQVRFVQEANTDQQKKALFDLVKSGQVRVLIGSTPRMGAGTNVQDRLVGLHHVDVTWKPSDIEQREGRIVRQGNLFVMDTLPTGEVNPDFKPGFTVDVTAYATEMTVDAKMWALNAAKLKAINGIRKYDGAFNMEVEDEESASMAEMAALATGNPLMVERVTLSSDIDKLESAQRGFDRRINGLRDNLARARRAVDTFPGLADGLENQAKGMDRELAGIKERADGRSVTINGVRYTDKAKAELAAENAVTEFRKDNPKARFSIDIDGEKVTSQEAIDKAIDGPMGTPNFEGSIGGQVQIDAGELFRLIESDAMAKGSVEYTLSGIKYQGANIEIDVAPSRYGDGTMKDVSFVAVDADGKEIASYGSTFKSASLPRTSIRDGMNKLGAQIAPSALRRAAESYRERAADEGARIPDLEAAITKSFPQVEELAAKRQRLADVIGLLAGTSDAARMDEGAAPAFSRGASDAQGVKPVDLQLSGWSGSKSELSALARQVYTEDLQGTTVHNASMGADIAFTSEGKAEAFGTRGKIRSTARAEMVKVLRELVEGAVKVAESEPAKGRASDSRAFHTLVGAMTVNGDMHAVRVTVTVRESLAAAEGQTPHKFYDVTSVQIERSPDVHGLNAAEGDASRPASVGASEVSVSDLMRALKMGGTTEQDVRYSFAGRNAATADRHALATAEQRIAAGHDAEEVRQDTGWSRDVDGKWKFEINDSDAKLLLEPAEFREFAKAGGAVNLADVLDHPALFAAYPALRDLPVGQKIGRGATYSPGKRQILMGNQVPGSQFLSVLMHEVQHGIQTIEGFATGGSVSQYRGDASAKRSQYQREAGEVEARNVQQRLQMNAAARRAFSPDMTADVAPQDRIVSFNGVEAKNAPSPANAANQAAGLAKRINAIQKLDSALRERWKNAPEIVAVASMQDPKIPQAVRGADARQRSQGATGEPEGFYLNGKVYVVASQMKTGADVVRVVLHETLGHHGLRGVFGKSLEKVLNQVVLGRRGDIIAKAREYGLVGQGVDAKTATDKEVWASMSQRQRLEAAEEVLANLAQTQPELGIVQRAIAAIRTWLRENIPALADMNLSDSEIVANFIQPARQWVERGGPEGGGARGGRAPAMSRGQDQTTTPAFKKWFGDSKVVDAQGKPLQVYHGTPARVDFNAFSKRPSFFSPDPAYASHFGNVEGGRVMPTYLSLKNPLDARELGTKRIPTAQVLDFLQRNGVALPADFEQSLRDDKGMDEWWYHFRTAPDFQKAIEAAGFDGMIQREAVGALAADAYVAFRPEQIKSAIGNSGAFDATNPDIRFSRTTEAAKNIGDGLKAMTVTDVKTLGDRKLTDWMKIGLQFLGRRQLVDIYGKDLPMTGYNNLVAQMEADKNDVGAAADELARRWGSLKDHAKLSDLMHDATLAEIDADTAVEHKAGDDKAKSQLLKARFKALSPEAQAVYREARDHYREHHKQVRRAIRDRIERSELSSKKKQELLEKMDADFFGYVKGVYFPLARFGSYVVATKDAGGNVISVSRAETMNEAETLRAEMRKAFPASQGYEVGRVTLSKDFVANHDMVGRGFMTELYSALEKAGIDGDKKAELEDTLGQLYLSSLPDLSWAKHGIHRKGTPGFSQDARRAFAQNSFHGARYLAKLKYSDLMQDELRFMQEAVDAKSPDEAFDQPKAQRVVDEMQKRHDTLMNPKTNSLSTALTSFGFIFHLGLSPAAAMVNLSQTALVAYPVMGAKWGFDKSAAALLRASKESVQGKNDIRTQLTNKDEIKAYDEAVRSGVIDVTMAHDLAGIAQGEDAGVMWKLRPVMRWASFLFHHAERFNRQATFIAAYRLARDAGADHVKAYDEAVQATYDGHFDYGSANRPRVMQGNVARVVLLFKQFSQNMIYTVGRNAYLAAKGDRQALKTLAGVLTMHAGAAGVLGLPLVGPLLALASALGGDDDDPWNAEIELRNMLADVFGPAVSEVIAKGFSRLTPWDISGRVALNNLIFPDVREGLEGKQWAQEFATGMLGPVAGIGLNAARGVQNIAEGRVERGLEDMMPVVPRNAIKSYRFWDEGAKDQSGIVIKDEVGIAGVVGQLVGFSPSEVRLAFEGKAAVMDADRRLNKRRADLLAMFSRGAMGGDQALMDEARAHVQAFNEANPGRRITVPQLWQSVRSRQRRIDQAENGVYLPRNRREAMDDGRFAFDPA